MNITKIQRIIETFIKTYQLESPIEHRCLDLQSEVGELAKEILKTSNYGRESNKPITELENYLQIKSELGDVLYSLITIAVYYQIDLEKSLLSVIDKYQARLVKGSAGSEND